MKKPNKKQIALAGLTALEYAIAVAVAKHIANTIADADADAFENLQELRHRVNYLEGVHGLRWSAKDEEYRACSTANYQPRHGSITDEDGRVHTSILD